MTALNISRLAIKIQNKAEVSVTDIKLVAGRWWVEVLNGEWRSVSELLKRKV